VGKETLIPLMHNKEIEQSSLHRELTEAPPHHTTGARPQHRVGKENLIPLRNNEEIEQSSLIRELTKASTPPQHRTVHTQAVIHY
jgi:hypothetical protein